MLREHVIVNGVEEGLEKNMDMICRKNRIGLIVGGESSGNGDIELWFRE